MVNKKHVYAKTKKPWYSIPHVWFLVIGLPLLAVIACIGLVTYSFKVADSTVRDDWYMDGKTLKQDLTRDKLAADWRLNAKASLQRSGNISLRLTSQNNEVFNLPKTLSLNLYHATEKSKDIQIRLSQTKSGSNHYSGSLGTAFKQWHTGKYYAELSDDVWRLRSTINLPTDTISFKPLDVYLN